MGRRPGGKNRPYTSISSGSIRESVQESAFPSSEPSIEQPPPQAAKISNEAKEKESILEAAKKIPEIFTTEQVRWIFDCYVALLCFIYSIALKTDFSALQEELSFSDEQ